jgi:hypothetical protein
MNEGNGNAQGGMGAEVPLRLTRRALFDLRLDDMRRRGEPTEGMSQRAPTPSYSSEDSKEREARGLALIKAHGITSMWSSERERLQRHGEKLQALQDQRDEEQRLWIEVFKLLPYTYKFAIDRLLTGLLNRK